MTHHERLFRGEPITWVEGHRNAEARAYPYTFMVAYPTRSRSPERTLKAVIKEVSAWCTFEFGPPDTTQQMNDADKRTWWHSAGCFRIEGDDRALAFKLRWL